MNLQECPACLARIDVSQFPVGERVSCGGCGNVLVVQPTVVPPVAPPLPPAAPPRAPPRPPPRPAGPAARRPAAHRPKRRARAPRRPGAPNPALLIGSAALLLVAVVVGIAVSGRDEDAPEPGTNTATAPTPEPKEGEGKDGWKWVLKKFEEDYKRKPATTKADFLAAIDRLQRIGDPAKDVLRRVYADYVKGPGRDSEEARRFLGHYRFEHEVPEAIAFREYPYIRAVEFAAKQRWFAPEEKAQFDAATSAYQLVLEHEKKLATDRKFRALDQIRANVARDPYLRDYKFAVRWAEPYVICYSSHHRLSDFDLLSITDPDDREQMRQEIADRQRSFQGILDEKAVLFTDVYREFLRRYRERYDLKDLMAEWGGRPDYATGDRSFKDGCPLVVWIFTDRKAFQEYHAKVRREEISPFIAGYFSPISGYVFLFDEKKDRLGEINKNVHEAIHQLVHWFTRQRNGWKPPNFGQGFFSEGFAEWFGSVQMGADHKLTFVGVNVPRVRAMQRHKLQFEAAKREYPIFPVEQLTSFGSYAEVARWGMAKWKLPGPNVLLLFYEQSWALVHFLHSAAKGKYRDQLVRLVGADLSDQMGFYDKGKAFKSIFKVRSKRDYVELDDEFQAFIKQHLMRMDVERFAYDPPKLGTFGGR